MQKFNNFFLPFFPNFYHQDSKEKKHKLGANRLELWRMEFSIKMSIKCKYDFKTSF